MARVTDEETARFDSSEAVGNISGVISIHRAVPFHRQTGQLRDVSGLVYYLWIRFLMRLRLYLPVRTPARALSFISLLQVPLSMTLPQSLKASLKASSSPF